MWTRLWTSAWTSFHLSPCIVLITYVPFHEEDNSLIRSLSCLRYLRAFFYHTLPAVIPRAPESTSPHQEVRFEDLPARHSRVTSLIIYVFFFFLWLKKPHEGEPNIFNFHGAQGSLHPRMKEFERTPLYEYASAAPKSLKTRIECFRVWLQCGSLYLAAQLRIHFTFPLSLSL